MRFLALAAAAAALLTILPVPGAQAASSMAKPDRSVGDFWELTGANPDGSTGYIRIEVTGLETITVGGVAYDAVKTHTVMGTRAVGQPDNVSSASDEWERASDGASLRYAYDSAGSGGGTGSGEYAQPCAFVQWPLEVGKTWRVDCDVSSQDSVGGAQAYAMHGNATVLREESVTTPAGSFDAFVVETVYGSDHETAWYAPAACHHVKTEGNGGGDARLLAAFHCAKAASAASPTPVSSTPAASTPASTTVASSTPPASSGEAPSPTPTTDQAPASPSKDTPGPGAALVAVGVALGALAMRRRS